MTGRDLVRGALGCLLGFAVYTILGRIAPSGLLVFNVFILVVAHFAMTRGEAAGALMGAACGLVQDAFSRSVLGTAGIALTLTGFLAGVFAQRFDMTPLRRLFLFLFAVAAVELAVWMSLSSLIYAHRIDSAGGLLFLQPLNTALWGGLIFYALRRLRERAR
ncbi:MAG: rod shape-determining protein MreD [Candidatus Aminicenantes bacterium]|nr:rod shape-determining protein MreD [Candidatus Aminicenantes bacterium]